MSAQVVPSPRRYYLLKRHEARAQADQPLDGVWRAKQEAQPGTPLPASFPHLARLAAGGYTAQEDLAGATVDELASTTDLNRREAAAVVAAYAAL